jgi:hypothetical protein
VGEDVEVLERLTVGVVAVHVERPPHLQRQAGESKLGDPGSTETASEHTLASESTPLMRTVLIYRSPTSWEPQEEGMMSTAAVFPQ